jgi:hypothetical protein
MDRDVRDLCCVNSRCPDYGQRGGENLMFRKFFGSGPWRFVRCRTCRKEFSERQGTALFGVRTPTDTVISVLDHLGDGCGVRQTARLTGVTTNTVMRLAKKIGGHAQATHDELARHLKAGEVQLDEKWSFVGKKRSTVRPGRSG